MVAQAAAMIDEERLRGLFEYLRGDELVTQGRQEIACLRALDGAYVPVAVPDPLRIALAPYHETAPA